ncbi:gamma-glutamyltransferase family protein [Streptomyces uncialis]|uniref:gamma-glutamyltransferase family protein n=1 Tax=Streptomyces uncialis TaxID=1048205 RepID=UPI0038686DB8|nr:gamma-glutamyltransferase [Streptomyces uncialis]
MNAVPPAQPASAAAPFALAAPHALATGAGDAVRAAGGNAVDAALAAAIALTVVYPHQCAVGGDLIALVALPDGRTLTVNGSGAAAAGADPGAFSGPRMPVTGARTVTVPGVVAGWATLHELAGRLPWERLFDAAVTYARDGVPTAPGVATALRQEAPLLLGDPGMREVFFPDGVPLATGAVLRQPALARSLALLAERGPKALYDGELGAGLVELLRSLGSPLTRDDLARHTTEVTEPLATVFRGEEYLTAPPNSQGLHLLQALALVERMPRDAELLGSDASLLARIFDAITQDRDSHLADPRQVDVPVAELLGAAHLDTVAERVLGGERALGGERTASVPGAARRAQAARPSGDTVAVVAADAEGYAVSLIQSLFHSFGSGILDPGSGIVLHNRGSFFDLAPGAPNRLAGGRRPAHTLMPVLTRRDGVISGAHGTMGGKAQPQIHTHLALRLAAGDDPVRALGRPRWVIGGLGVDEPAGVASVEGSVPAEALSALVGAGYRAEVLAELDEQVGHGQVVRRREDGGFDAGTDPRSDGAVAVRRA